MDSKLCITYKSTKTQDVALQAVSMYFKSVHDGDLSIPILRKLCGAISYSSLFLIEDYKLIDDRKYTSASICQYVYGLFKIPTRNFLNSMMRITICNETDIPLLLESVIEDCMFGEIVSQFRINPKDLYCSLLLFYLHLNDQENLLPKFIELWNNPCANINDIWNIMEGDVLNVR